MDVESLYFLWNKCQLELHTARTIKKSHDLRRSRASHTDVLVREFSAVAYIGCPAIEICKNGLGFGNQRPSRNTISDGLTTVKRVKIGTVSETASGSDYYTVKEISCLTFWLRRAVHLERDASREL